MNISTEDQMAFTVKGAAKLAGILRNSLYRKVTTGELKSIKIGKSRRILRTDLIARLESLRAN